MSARFSITAQQPAIYGTYITPWGGCNNASVYWYANQHAIVGAPSGDYNVLISVDSGYTYTPLASNINRGTQGTQSWGSYQIPNVYQSNVFVKVEDAQDTTKYSISTRIIFTPTTDVSLVTPNNGEQWIALENEQIHYTTDPSVSSVDIDISNNGGNTWTEIADDHSGGAFTWNVWNNPSTTSLIRVRDHSNSCKTDVSLSLIHI